VTLPDWLPIDYPDAEIVLMDLLALTGVETTTWLPEGWEPPLAQVNRIGGAPDASDVTDYALMRVAYYGSDRQAAQNLASDGTRLIKGFAGRSTPSGVLIDFATVEVGNLLEPDLDPDDRRVTVNYTLGFRRQYHLAPA
jgi:hypothetical protein